MDTIYKNSQYLIVLITSTLGGFFASFFIFTIPILIYEMTSSVFAMSTMRAIEFIPNLVLAIFIGVIVDRYKRKNMLLIATITQIVCIGAIIFLITASTLNLAILYILSFIIFVTVYMKGSAKHSILPNMVHNTQLSDANAKLSFYGTVSGIIAPSLAGICYSLYGVNFNIAVYLIGTMIVLFLYFFIKVEEKIERSGKNIKGDIMDGWHALTENKDLWNLTIIILFINLSSSISGAVLTFFALDSIEISEMELGYIFTGSAIAALTGAQLTKHAERLMDKGKIFTMSYYISLGGYLLLFFAHHWVAMLISMFMIGMAVTLNNIQYLSLRQTSTPNHLLGRVAGTSSMIMKLSMPLTFLISGIIGEMIDVRYMFIFSVAVLIFVIFFSFNKRIYMMK